MGNCFRSQEDKELCSNGNMSLTQHHLTQSHYSAGGMMRNRNQNNSIHQQQQQHRNTPSTAAMVEHMPTQHQQPQKQVLPQQQISSYGQAIDYNVVMQCGPGGIGGYPVVSTNPASSTAASRVVRVHALYNYTPENADELHFSKGDVMLVQSGLSEAWWLAKHQDTGEQGYIPSNYVVIDNGLPTWLDAWYDITRRDADRRLIMPGLKQGTYILRPSSDTRSFALSIRYEPEQKMFLIKHYKVRTRDNNAGYFITNRATFTSIQDLLTHYQNTDAGLCCRLTQPCPRQYVPPVQFRDIEVNRKSIELIERLGSGSFGEVFLARWNRTFEVAVKSRLATTDVKVFIEEAKLMHKLHHRRIVKLLGVCTEPPEFPVYIITELMSKGALNNFLRSSEGRALNLADLIDMIAQIAEGMSYLEEMNSVHRDLRTANILVDVDNSVKVADFGLAKMLNTDAKSDVVTRFPIKWTAPEAAMPVQLFSIKSDVWSFGVLMYEIVTYGGSPYQGMSNKQVMQEVERGYRMPNPHTPQRPCPDDMYQIMLDCWSQHPDDRPTFRYLYDIFDNWTVQTEQQYTDNDI